MSRKEPETIPFEKALGRLEEIVAKLETGDVDLEKSIELYAEGQKLGAICSARLSALDQKVKAIRERPDGTLELQPFDDHNASE